MFLFLKIGRTACVSRKKLSREKTGQKFFQLIYRMNNRKSEKNQKSLRFVKESEKVIFHRVFVIFLPARFFTPRLASLEV